MPNGPSLADRSRRWYEAHAGRYDRHHPGLAGDADFYAGLASGRRVLEIGAGTGRITAALATAALSVVAIEIAPAMLRRARQRLAHTASVDLLIGDGRQLPIVGPFDLAVLAYRTLHHFDAADRRRLFEGVRSVLAPGGVLAFDTWHGPSASPGGSRGAPPSAPIDQHTLRADLSRDGFHIIVVAKQFQPPESAGGLSRVWITQSCDPVERKNSRSP